MASQTNAKPGFFKRIGSFFSKSWSELKKVSWPSFKTVLKNTGIVFLVVLFFTAIILLSDWAFLGGMALLRGI